MAKKWVNNVRHVQRSEPVTAGVVSRPDRTLEGQTGYLKDRLDASALGRAIFDTDATLSPDLLEGQPAFWNGETQRYEQALAAVENDAESGTLVVQPSSECVGVVYAKTNATQGHVCLSGIVKLSSITNAIDGDVEAGRYYLSSAAAGKLVKQRPSVTVAVCYVLGAKETCADDPWVIINPQVRDFLEDHIHYRFTLTCLPAGMTSAADAVESGRHTITDPDITEPGWLPADHETFDSKAPTGAAFGYNLGAHEALQRVWPPVPLQAVAVLWDKGQALVGATEVPLGPTGLVVVDGNGIWWMSDCVGDAPWPEDYDNTTVDSSSSSSAGSESSATAPECPRTETMRIEIVYLRQVFGNDRTVVTSLQPGPDSPITVSNCDGDPATTGDLKLGLDLNFILDPELVDGAVVFKQLADGFKFKRGVVTEGLIAGDDSITLTGTIQRPLSDAEDAPTVHQGIVSMVVNLEPTDRELPPQIVRLADAVERLYKDVPYVAFPEAQDSSVRLRINVPPAGLPATPKLKIRAVLLGRVAATLPPLTVTYRRLPTPAAGGPVQALPTSDTSLTFDSELPVGVDQMVTVESQDFTIAAGDTVLVTIARASDAGYAGEVGIIRWGGVLISG